MAGPGYAETESNRLDRPKEENIYDVHRRVVAQWRKCCEEAAEAQCRLAQAKEEMDITSKNFYDYLQRTMTDPTLPQPPENGAAQRQVPGQLQQSWTAPSKY